jgi:hypothetical protein
MVGDKQQQKNKKLGRNRGIPKTQRVLASTNKTQRVLASTNSETFEEDILRKQNTNLFKHFAQ